MYKRQGTSTYWQKALAKIMQERTGGFSVHSPFTHVNMATTDDEDDLFAELSQAFPICNQYSAEFYVVHPNGILDFAPNESYEEELRKRAIERLLKFDFLCAQNGIQMVIENLGFRQGCRPLFDQSSFLQIFHQYPHLRCLVDTGHATLGGYDIATLQQKLGSKILGYHLHDNNGFVDQHMRIGTGVIDWALFGENFAKYTPDANVVLEYNSCTESEILEDFTFLETICQSKT